MAHHADIFPLRLPQTSPTISVDNFVKNRTDNRFKTKPEADLNEVVKNWAQKNTLKTMPYRLASMLLHLKHHLVSLPINCGYLLHISACTAWFECFKNDGNPSDSQA